VRTCIDCTECATHKGRCKAHHNAYEGRASVRARRKRRAVIARGNNAAANARKAARKAGYVECASCRMRFLASAVDVDHIKPLAHGGEDVDENVQLLCRPCHKLKTRGDFGIQAPPF
jgi:5-methylcytosine-specific restriction protein A